MNFLNARLTDPRPISRSDRKVRFKKEIIEPFSERVDALNAYEEACRVPTESFIRMIHNIGNGENEVDITELKEEEVRNGVRQKDAHDALIALLSDDERKRLSDEYFKKDAPGSEYDKICVEQCRLWTTKRAFELGWIDELFPNDRNIGSYSRFERDIERIGKKYQRIAFDELQARLADNFWFLEGEQERPKHYRYSHHGFRREIEPTILPSEAHYFAEKQEDKVWLSDPIVISSELTQDMLKIWLFSDNLTAKMEKKFVRIDQNNQRWLVLYEFNLAKVSNETTGVVGHGSRNEECRQIFCVFVENGKVDKFGNFLIAQANLDVTDFEPKNFIDGPYLREAFWRQTWSAEKFDNQPLEARYGLNIAIPVAHFQWESHLDRSLPEGFTNYMPQMWFADELGVFRSLENLQYWCDKEGNRVIQSHGPGSHYPVLVMDEISLRRYAREFQIEPVWIMISERRAWPGGVNDNFCGRRSQSAAWFDGQSWKQVGRNHDTNPSS